MAAKKKKAAQKAARKKTARKTASRKKAVKKKSSTRATTKKTKKSGGTKKAARKTSSRKKTGTKKKAASRKSAPTKKKTKKTAARKKQGRASKQAKKARSLGRPRVPADARLDHVFQKDYQAREVFEFLGVHTVRELEQYGPDEIIDKLTGPMVETVHRIRKTLALSNRSLADDREFALEFRERVKSG